MIMGPLRLREWIDSPPVEPEINITKAALLFNGVGNEQPFISLLPFIANSNRGKSSTTI
jgi:hypothetical protein